MVILLGHLYFAAGFAIGMVYFSSVWSSANRIVSERNSIFAVMVEPFLRLLVLAVIFALAIQSGTTLLNIAITLLGFTISRFSFLSFVTDRETTDAPKP